MEGRMEGWTIREGRKMREGRKVRNKARRKEARKEARKQARTKTRKDEVWSWSGEGGGRTSSQWWPDLLPLSSDLHIPELLSLYRPAEAEPHVIEDAENSPYNTDAGDTTSAGEVY
jgi:hypothetical protein